MIIYLTVLISFFTCLILNIPMTGKPLSEDEGNWYYLAVFWKRGVRLFKNLNYIYGYFGIPWMGANVYNLFNSENLTLFHYFKAVWYSLTSVSIYWLTFCFWQNHTISLMASIIFSIIIATPNTLFSLTYGEHFFILPINLSLIFTYYGLSTDHLIFFILAGLMTAWAFHIKPTTLLFSILLPLVFYFSSQFLEASGSYFLIFVIFNLFPILIIKKHGNNAIKFYIMALLGPIVIYINIILTKLKIAFLNTCLKKVYDYFEINKDSYIRDHQSKSIQIQWSDFKRFVMPAIKDLYLVLILSVGQVLYLFIKFDPLAFSMVILFIIFLSMQQVQKNYYTPHFNPCWIPITILAAKTVCDMWPYLTNRGIFGWTIIALAGHGLSRIVRIIIKSFFKSEKNSFGHLDPLFGMVYRLSESIGEYIQRNSKKNDKLFVWGDQPSLYLYAKREAFNTNYLFIYAHQGRILLEKELLDSLREKPPELLIFYNYKVLDGWNIKRLQETIGVPYDHMKSFQVTDDSRKNEKNPHGICFDFPLYRRDDEKYKEILLDRALIAETNKDVGETRKQLTNILEIFPEDYEASVRLSLLENNINGSKSTQDYLKERLAENHDSIKNAVLLRLLAEIDIDAGNLDNAVRNYEKALDINPNDFRTHNGLGELSFSIGNIRSAFESFKKSIELHPYSSEVLNNIGVLLSQSGKREDAIKYFQKALSFMPSHPDARKNIEALT
ncbi:MAG: tetratricopeptide repeat protein [Thermodesulfobacteriota bacterium]